MSFQNKYNNEQVSGPSLVIIHLTLFKACHQITSNCEKHKTQKHKKKKKKKTGIDSPYLRIPYYKS